MSAQNDEYWQHRREDERGDEPKRAKVYRCKDRTCGGLDCASCYGEQVARRYMAEQSEREDE